MIASCPGHYEPSDFDLNAIEKAGSSLQLIETEEYLIDKELWPNAIKSLNPESVYKNEYGIYIKLDSFFVEESGIYFPQKGINVKTGNGYDPSYKKLNGNVYSYYIKG